MPPPITSVAPLALDPQLRSRPFQQFNPLQGFGGTGGGMADAVMQAMGQSMFQGSGYFPIGIGNRNPYDQLESFRLQTLKNQVMSGAARDDADSAFQFFAGMHRMSGVPMGESHFKTYAAMSNMIAAAGPAAVDIFGPSLIDKLGGYRGSSMVMASEMIHGSRFRLDPVTGRPGMSADSIESLRGNMTSSLFSEQGARQMGMSQGEAGMLFSELQQLGMGGGMSRRERMDITRQFAASQGKDVNQMEPGELERLKASPELAAQLRSFDAEAVKRSLKDYSKAVLAMQDIFGASGRGEGSMGELINALQQMTGGAMTQLKPADVERMARTTYNMAKNTGIGLEGALMLSEAASQQAMSMGLSPVFASETLQGSLGFRAAYQNQNMGAMPAWGMSGINEQMTTDMGLRTAAARSTGANRAGAVLRMEEAMGGEGAFDKNSDLGRYVAAIRAGQTTFMDSANNQRSIRLDDDPSGALPDDVIRQMMAAGAGFAGAENMLTSYIMDEGANQEYIFKRGLTGTFRKSQGQEFFKDMKEDIGLRTADALAGGGLNVEASGRLGASLTSAVVDRMSEMTLAERTEQDVGKRNAPLIAAAKTHLAGLAAAGDADAQQALNQMDDPEFAGALIGNLWGNAETFSRETAGGLGYGNRSLQDQLQQFDPETLRIAEQARVRAEGQSMTQEALAPLRGAGMFRNAVEAVMTADDGTDLTELFLKTMGGAAGGKLAGALGKKGENGKTLLEDLQAKTAAYDAIQAQFEAAKPEDQEKLLADVAAAREAMAAAVQSVTDMGERTGSFNAESKEAGGKGGRQILAEHAARLEGTDVGQITDEELEKYFGADHKDLATSLDAGARHKRATFDELLQERGEKFDTEKAAETWQGIESGQTTAESRPVTIKIEFARIEANKDGSGTLEGEGQADSPVEPGRQA